MSQGKRGWRLRLFRAAEELGNASAACREPGISRSSYYQLRERFLRYGPETTKTD